MGNGSDGELNAASVGTSSASLHFILTPTIRMLRLDAITRSTRFRGKAGYELWTPAHEAEGDEWLWDGQERTAT